MGKQAEEYGGEVEMGEAGVGGEKESGYQWF